MIAGGAVGWYSKLQTIVALSTTEDLCLYWLRDKVEHGMLNPDFIPTGDMIADCLTKSVPTPKVRFCREQMGVIFSFLFLTLLIYLHRHIRLWGGLRVMVTCDCI